jgi:hypothetical protein
LPAECEWQVFYPTGILFFSINLISFMFIYVYLSIFLLRTVLLMYPKILMSTRITLYVRWVMLQTVFDLHYNYIVEGLMQIRYCTSQK